MKARGLFHLNFISNYQFKCLFYNLTYYLYSFVFSTMPFGRKLPGVSNSADVKNQLSGTEKANSVAEKDIHFWLPLTKPHPLPLPPNSEIQVNFI